MPFNGLELPNITPDSFDTATAIRRILEAQFQLNEQLRFTLNNLDESNFSKDLSYKFQTAFSGVVNYGKIITDIAALKQYVEGLTLVVANSGDHSTINLVSGAKIISTREITFSNAVMASDLLDGTADIDGGNITAGLVAADRIDTEFLKVLHLDDNVGADGIFNGTMRGALEGAAGTFVALEGTDYLKVAAVTLEPTGISILDDDPVHFYMNAPTTSGGIEARWVDEGTHYALNVYTSKRADKKDIETIGNECSAFIDNLKPVYFRFKSDDPASIRSVGFIAEETAAACKEVTAFGPGQIPCGVQYSNITAIIVAELQRLRRRVFDLEHSA